MGLFKKILGDLIKANVGDRGSIPGRPPQRTYPKALPPGEWDELADAERTQDEAKAAEILAGLDSEEAKLLTGQWIQTPQSTHQSAFRWLADTESAEVIFKDGSIYRVDPISKEEAIAWLHSPSKGGWYWDEVRIRGTALGHKKNYVFLSGPSKVGRKWNATAASAAAHGRKVDLQSRAPSASAFAKGGLGKKRGKRK